MFHFGKSCEISFQASGSNEGQNWPKDVGTDSELLAAKPPTGSGHRRKRRGRESEGGTGSGSGGEDDVKKITHRDTERQRRVAMAALLHTLSSLLPSEFVKGKRAMSDHIAETVNYINHLQKKTKDLTHKRDKLRAQQANYARSLKEDISLSSTPRNVAIHIGNVGLEIQITGGHKEDELRLSNVLKVLLDEGLSVVCSVSSKVNAVFIHNIQCKISVNIDLQRLQQRLYDVVCSNNSSSSMYAAGTDLYSPFELMEKENQIYSSFLIM